MNPEISERVKRRNPKTAESFQDVAEHNSAELEKLDLPVGPMLSHPPAGNKPKRDEAGRFIYETPASE